MVDSNDSRGDKIFVSIKSTEGWNPIHLRLSKHSKSITSTSVTRNIISRTLISRILSVEIINKSVKCIAKSH